MEDDQIADGCGLVKLDGVLILLTTARRRSECSQPEWWDKADVVIEVIHIEGTIRTCRIVQERAEYRAEKQDAKDS